MTDEAPPWGVVTTRLPLGRIQTNDGVWATKQTATSTLVRGVTFVSFEHWWDPDDTLLVFPPEIIMHILSTVSPVDIISVAGTCKRLRAVIVANTNYDAICTHVAGTAFYHVRTQLQEGKAQWRVERGERNETIFELGRKVSRLQSRRKALEAEIQRLQLENTRLRLENNTLAASVYGDHFGRTSGANRYSSAGSGISRGTNGFF